MKRKTKRIITGLTVSLLILFVFAIGELNRNLPIGTLRSFLGISRSSVYIGILIGWTISVKSRVIQEMPRHFLLLSSFLIFLWFLFRFIKYYLVDPMTNESRYLWYCYYISFLSIPMCTLFLSFTIGKRDDYRLPKWTASIVAVTVLVFLLVITNDLHQLVFVFPDDAVIFNDGAYSYGIGHVAVTAWILVCALGSVFIMASKCRFANKRNKLLLTIIPIAMAAVYCFLYALGYVGIFDDITVIIAGIIVLTFEICMQIGLIRTNTNYRELFTSSASQALITDNKLNIVYAGKDIHNIDKTLLEKVISKKELIYENHRFRSSEIDGGYVVWYEDISKLIRLQAELEFTNEYLSGKNIAVTKKYKTDMRRKRLEENNRLYNKMQNESAAKLDKLSYLLNEFEQCNGPEKEKILLLQISVILVYLKRRNNLIFISRNQQDMPTNELKTCINESAKNLDVFGIFCASNIETKLLFKDIITFYDMLEEILENTAQYKPSYLISVENIGNRYVMTVRISDLKEMTLPQIDGLRIVQDGKEEWYLEFEIAQKGGAI